MSLHVDVAVIGGGPAGLAAAIAASQSGAQTLLIEREARLGGILKQCVHDGFGLVRYGEKLAGPEYAQRFINALKETDVTVFLQTFVDKIKKHPLGYHLFLVSAEGVKHVFAKALVLATGCRERTAKQIAIHGTRPAGVLTAGSAQYYTNMLGQLPGRRCVVLGSGDIGLIMARRLTLEGAKVLGVYEAKAIPSGLPRNIAQCLNDFDIPLHLSKTVTRCFGHARLEAVEIASVDEHMRPIAGTEECLPCDALILSVGLIPENELAETLKVQLDPVTKGPICDQNTMTNVPGIFCCGNAAHVNDLVDYVSESGETAGRAAAAYSKQRKAQEAVQAEASEENMLGISKQIIQAQWNEITAGEGFLYAMPQRVEHSEPVKALTLYFRSREERGKTRVTVRLGDQILLQKKYNQLRPPEMERMTLKLEGVTLQEGDVISLEMEALA